MSRPFASSARAFTSTSNAVSVPRRAIRLARRSSEALVMTAKSATGTHNPVAVNEHDRWLSHGASTHFALRSDVIFLIPGDHFTRAWTPDLIPASSDAIGTMVGKTELILICLVAVALLAIVARKIRIPYPILLTIGGVVLALVPGLPAIHLDPQLVFNLFLPPLLYPAAIYTSWSGFR